LQTSIDLIVEQTKPKQTEFKVIGSKIPSEIRYSFFECCLVPYVSLLSEFKEFTDPENKARLLNEVNRYAEAMSQKFLRGNIDEKLYVQPEIRGTFWKNTKMCLHHTCVMTNEKHYTICEENVNTIVTGSGKTDHTIHLQNSSIASLTIEDKALGHVFESVDISQGVSQVKAEIRLLQRTFAYEPGEYVGLLQNGQTWILLQRKIFRGQVLWRHSTFPDAFTIIKPKKGLARAEIHLDNCLLIARMIEHAYCISDAINGEILNPTLRPLYVMPTHSERNDDSEDDEDTSDVDPQDDTRLEKDSQSRMSAAAVTPARQDLSRHTSQKSSNDQKKSRLDVYPHSTYRSTDDFLLPLSIANVARCAASVR
jgi:hypothetical protein